MEEGRRVETSGSPVCFAGPLAFLVAFLVASQGMSAGIGDWYNRMREKEGWRAGSVCPIGKGGRQEGEAIAHGLQAGGAAGFQGEEREVEVCS